MDAYAAGEYAGFVFFWALVGAIACAMIARRKGRSAGAWAIGGFFLGLLGILILVLLPRGTAAAPGMKHCPRCAAESPDAAAICQACHSAFAAQTLQRPYGLPPWPGHGNVARVACRICGRWRPFTEDGACTKCGTRDEAVRFFWGLRPDPPPAGPDIAAGQAGT